MPSEPQSTVDEQADNAVRDRAQPPLYKSAVRALLGMPESEGANITFPLPLAPVGFQYLLHAWSDEPAPPPDPKPEIGHPTPDVMPAGNQHTAARFPQKVEPLHDVAMERLRAVADLPERPPARTATPAAGQHQDPPPQRTRPHQTDVASGVTPPPGTDMVPPTAVAPTVEPEHPDKEKEKVPEGRVLTVSGLPPQAVYVPVFSPGGAGETSAAGGTEPRRPQVPTADAPQPEVWRIPSGIQGPTTSVEATIPAGGDVPSRPGAGRRTPTRVQGMAAPMPPTIAHADTVPVPGPSRDTAAEIEQLRRMVRELAAKMAVRQAKVPHESLPQQAAGRPSPTPPRLIVVKQAAARSRLPHAFWERSHLPRSSLQPWR